LRILEDDLPELQPVEGVVGLEARVEDDEGTTSREDGMGECDRTPSATVVVDVDAEGNGE
jgi:hypothetical protein